ncbi:MAG: cellulose-binding protein [Dactylosporangium sp.]|nr:cellulose binding domain-containing protein [Dactylosporangium sp.]NNJ61876.1 cellulose-binding protein [Dactylosporangium sp.]
MTRRHRWWLVALGAAAVVTVGGVGAAVAATGPESSGLTAEFQKSADWGTGYEATYTISNPQEETVDGWRVEFALPASATLGAFWEATITSGGDGHVATNKAYNGSLAPGASTRFGFIVAGSGDPLSCTINDAPCAGGSSTPTATATGDEPAPSAEAPSSPAAPGSPTASATPTGTAPPTAAVAPYVDMGAWPTPSLTGIMASSGLTGFTLGFVTGAGCKASWFGAYDPRAAWAKDQIDAVRAEGGSVTVSFGGASGIELAQACGDVTSLEAEYQAVVDAYGLTSIDLDIEGAASADTVSVDRRSAAIAQLQRERPGLRVSYTLPVLPEGLTADGLNVLRSAIGAGVAIDVVNVMAMDYYRAGSYGDFAVQAAQSTFAQLRSLYPSAGDAELWRRLGVTPMLGQNDDGHIFDQAAARQLVDFAAGQHLGLLSFWEVTRDANACTGALYKCTNISQEPYEFSRIFAEYGG